MDINAQLKEINSNENGATDTQMDNLVSAGILYLLNHDSLYGNILVNLNRKIDNNISSVLALKWFNNQLVLLMNPFKIRDFIATQQDLIDILQHICIHIIWLHPLRYKQPNNLADIAMDISVNQYVPHVYSQSWTLDKLSFNWNLELPKKKDSKDYLRLLSKFMPDKDKNGKGPLDNDEYKLVDDHKFLRDEDGSAIDKRDYLSKLINKAKQNTHNDNRGTMSHDVELQVKRDTLHKVSLKQIVGMAKRLSNKTKSSFARFNRRQPYRMELPGKISAHKTTINVFLDSSGSINNEQFSKMTAWIYELSNKNNMEIYLYPFDAEVKDQKKQRLTKNSEINNRVANGGTSYQAVFNFIAENQMRNNLNIILTDGKGETTLNNLRIKNVLWILIHLDDSLSVNNSVGKIIYLESISR
ncbi:VWA-like domain-containing protein [Apilactobacillus bombintestini]|uniref:VWA-like domain-containing protein n=1 Tax=Apilactobacillus bombintestini TaxID=2419772 RepID=A0A387ATF6_9LACO|nr:VWA-like domain-containing protein [Apilactobacillus bombintestini]AYF92629.1 hypothetical protein D7I45_03625 [Apilactobacillus bombintestini]